MSKRIPQPFIDELISRADILEVVGRRVSLKQAGANWKGLCPFHDEKTASFTVSPSKGFYHCFGCAAHGTALGFLMDYDNLSFPEAVEALAEMLGMPIPREAIDEPDTPVKALGNLLTQADGIYRKALRANQAAIDYLKNRGIDGATAAKFGIGYAPDAWDTILRELGTTEAARDSLVQCGLLRRNDAGRHYDYFRGRIMFPIRNPQGQVIGFGGRVLADAEPKYLNSPETPLFSKGQALYGAYEAREIPGRPEQVFVVEGYLDVISLAQHGIGPALATLGTATTAEHVRRLTRMAQRIVFCFDGDRAGRKAAWKALETALPFGGGTVELRFLMLPEGEDPDSLVRRHGAAVFEELSANAWPLSTFFIDALRSEADLSSADGRARLVTLARPLLARLPQGAYRELLLEELAQLTGLGTERLIRAVEPAGQQSSQWRHERDTEQPTQLRKPSLIQQAMTLLLHYPAIATQFEPVEGVAELDVPGSKLLRAMLDMAHADPNVKTGHLIERFRDDPEGKYLDRLLIREPLDDEDAAKAVLRDCLERIVATERRRQTVDAIKRRERPRDEP